MRRRWAGLLLPLFLLLGGCTATPEEPTTGPTGDTASAPFGDCAALTAPPVAAGSSSPSGAPSAALPSASGSPAANSSGGTPLPDLRLPCFTGGEAQVALADLRGPAVINLWASWCGPCRAELPAFQRLAQRTAGQLHVVGVNTSDRPAAATATGTELGLTFPNLVDVDHQVQRAVAPNVLPVTLLVDAEGRIRHQDVSGVLDDATLTELLRRHLGVAVPA